MLSIGRSTVLQPAIPSMSRRWQADSWPEGQADRRRSLEAAPANTSPIAIIVSPIMASSMLRAPVVLRVSAFCSVGGTAWGTA